MSTAWDGVPGLGPVRIRALLARGLTDETALLECLPTDYRDSTQPVAVAALREGLVCAVRGWIIAAPVRHMARGRQWVSASVHDDTGTLRCMWFGQPWMKDNLTVGQEVLMVARIVRKQSGLFAINPRLEERPGLAPVYKPVPGLPPKLYRALVARALEKLTQDDPLPAALRARHGLMGRHEALWQAHQPVDAERLMAARRRLAFEALLLYQCALLDTRRATEAGVQVRVTCAETDGFWTALPFAPTAAQARVLREICQDLARPTPMARLVQGDVGCGKTALALGALALCVAQGWQGALMAPTEILAQQHFDSARALLEPMGITCGLLTGSLTAAKRRQAHAAIAEGRWQVAIGTHALLSEGVRFARLGLVITDEQHRFGVRQRSALAEKGMADDMAPVRPNVLVLSATPIPRSLALVLYGDLDISVVDELPPGRTPVATRIVPEEKRAGMYGFIRREVAAGHQCYIVCPLVEEKQEDDMPADATQDEPPSAETMCRVLREGPLASLRVGLVHGQMKAADKEAALADFHSGRMDVLVATTVIEVGVNVPNASVMVIESAERFGLAQLHQLRGRVGRGAAESWCFLMAKPNDRLALLTETQDGFRVAQKDLELRGAGDFFGTRQHGQPGPGLAAAGADARLLAETQQAAHALRDDPALAAEAAQVFAYARGDFARRFGEAALN